MSDKKYKISRRNLLKTGAGVALSFPLPFALSACGVPTRPAGSFEEEGVLVGLFEGDGETAVKNMLSMLDFSWLKQGDSVFLKLACNSGNAHPATTSPSAVRAVVKELLALGAGQVIVGDQGGVEAVRLAEGNQRYQSTRMLMEGNGLLEAIEDSGGTAEFFDERDYEGGYFAATLPENSYWTEEMYLAEVIREVDHIVYLPRISSHVLAGYTHGHKIAVGWLRDDSRYHFHHKAEFFHEKYVEINFCSEIAERLRLTITLAESVLLYDGPDAGTIVQLEQPLVIASNSLNNHDAVSVAILAYYSAINERDPSTEGMAYSDNASTINLGFVSIVESWSGIPWGNGAAGYEPFTAHSYEKGIPQDRALRRAYHLEGGVPESIPVQLVGDGVSLDLLTALQEYSEGQLSVEST